MGQVLTSSGFFFFGADGTTSKCLAGNDLRHPPIDVSGGLHVISVKHDTKKTLLFQCEQKIKKSPNFFSPAISAFTSSGFFTLHGQGPAGLVACCFVGRVRTVQPSANAISNGLYVTKINFAAF